MINKVILLGNLGKDPEVRNLPSGQPVANFTIATNRQYKDRDGNRQKETEWHNIVVFGRQAEIASQYLHRGKQIYLEGRIRTRSWDDRETGQKRYMTEIVCENFQMLGGRGDAGGGGGGGGDWGGGSGGSGGGESPGGGNSGNDTPPQQGGADSGPDDDIPF